MPAPSTLPSSRSGRPIADALVLVSCAYTSLQTLEQFGLLARERVLYARLWPHFGRVIVVSYGDRADHDVAATLCPALDGRVECVCNERGDDPALFVGAAPSAVASRLRGCGSALVLTDQYWGGDVAVTTTRALREAGVRTGLCARGGYHWSWTMAREHGPASREFAHARFLEAELVHAADTVIATTERIVERLCFQHALPPARVLLVPNFLAPLPSAPLPGAREPGLIVTAGRLAREKRIDLLMRAVASLPAALRDRATLAIAGCGPEERNLRALAAGLPIRVEFPGRLSHAELLSLMGRASVYAQLSEYEGHPKTVLEALAMGAPTLVSDGPGIADQVEHGITGLIARPEPDSVAAGLTALLGDASAARRMAETAVARVRSTLHIDAVEPLYRAACVQAMAGAGSGRSLPHAVVRWDQPMLTLEPGAAARLWSASATAFARRLSPAARETFVQSLGMGIEAIVHASAAE